MKLEHNHYSVQGLDLKEVCKEFGTPLYVYDAEKMASQLEIMKSAFSGLNLKIKYAAKSLTNISVLKFLKSKGAELDVVSVQEAHLGLKAGFPPEQILFTPNCVSFDEIREGVEMGLMLNIDSISILEQFGHEYQDKVPCCIRLNPHLMAGGNTKISTGHVDSKFGISIYQLPHLQRVIKTNNIKVIGLHMHTGSDILDSEVYIKIADILFGVASDFKDLQFIDFGSGFKVGYKQGDITTDMHAVGKKLVKAFKDFCQGYGRELEIWFEPGKFVTSESGLLLARVNVVKTTPATA
ncbi:MAG: diaminopimelate decarboxylase, partial [Bacteroidetes bacterium]|nr:diaminopimelate decarboxylase [Bacteroidota bacterium]